MNLLRNRCGQGMTEYIVIVAIVAIAAIAGFKFFGKKVTDSITNTANQLEGTTGEGIDAGTSEIK
ncbi:MAG: hypothetical protein A2293_02300 [Elusimicrobia bacterium RIFOXYB2_FULL_49_7]|nr:MAG: hypothetical protein A2293_02300 [Elusimicrobia bacterium RIFOXYB2_FULL_49_7]